MTVTQTLRHSARSSHWPASPSHQSRVLINSIRASQQHIWGSRMSTNLTHYSTIYTLCEADFSKISVSLDQGFCLIRGGSNFCKLWQWMSWGDQVMLNHLVSANITRWIKYCIDFSSLPYFKNIREVQLTHDWKFTWLWCWGGWPTSM